MTIRLRDPSNQEPVFFVVPEVSTAICCRCPIGSNELQALLRVSKQLYAIVYRIYTKNVQEILKRYANDHTPLNRIVFRISTQPNFNPPISFETIGEIQQFLIQQIKILGIPCPNKHLVLEDIPRFNQALEDLNLQKIWGPIRQALGAVGEKPAENASAQEIRLWMDANKNHLQGIVRLDLSGKALTTIPQEITLLTGLQQLGLHNNQITVLPQGIFAGLNQLQVLGLHNNQISILPQGIFAGLIQLQVLGLNNNQITVLPQGIFAGLNQLQVLGLNNNQITVLPQGIFAGLNRLHRLGLNNNQITVLPQGIFAGLNQLQVLGLSNNQITVLPQGIFAGLNQLQQLGLYNNQITVLPQGIFAGLNQLQWLFLGNNQITALPQGIFAGLNRLHRLGLNNNQISVLPQGIFAGLNRLHRLGLNNNQISVLPQGIFAGLNLLQVLGLHYNQISVLPQGIFDALNQLQGLYLYGNPRLLFSYKDVQTPVNMVPDPVLNNDLTAFKEFNTYVCRSSFAKFYQFAAQENSFNDGMRYFSALPQYVRDVINARMCEEQNNSSSPDFRIALKNAVRWIFEKSTDELKNDIYACVLQLAQESDAVKRWQNPGLPLEDFTHPNWGRDHARDNILRLIDAMNLISKGLLG